MEHRYVCNSDTGTAVNRIEHPCIWVDVKVKDNPSIGSKATVTGSVVAILIKVPLLFFLLSRCFTGSWTNPVSYLEEGPG
jgi:hypothetical protein